MSIERLFMHAVLNGLTISHEIDQKRRESGLLFENKSFNVGLDPIQNLRALCSNDLNALDATITLHLEQRVPLIGTIANHLMRAGGKRLRPLLALASCYLFDQKPTQKMVELAAAVEFIHNATLLHDDVVDESKLRRGLPTANALFGNKASILVGDFLFSKAFELMLGENEEHVLPILAKVCQTITEGEVLQLSYLNTFDVSKDIMLKIIESKTAALFAASCSVGAALYNKSSSAQNALYTFGHYLGLAFQVADDVLDYMGTTKTLGKDVGDDLREGKVTLPLLVLYDHANDAEKQNLKSILARHAAQDQDFETVVQLMKKYAIQEICLNHARDFCVRAKDALAPFEDTSMHALFSDLVDSLLDRGC